jgi:hypothetical protein
MRSIAKWHTFGVFTSAEVQCPSLLRGVGEWRKVSSLVRTVAERLFCALATCTPEVFLAGFDIDGIRGFLGNDWIAHW